MNKNAYEIRLDILKMANDNIWQIYNTKLISARERAASKDDRTGDWINKVPIPNAKDIINVAEELYKFVEKQ